MTEFVEERGLGVALRLRVLNDATLFPLDYHPEMDESSDEDDPEATLGMEVRLLRAEVERWRLESEERHVLVGMAQAALESRRVTTDLEQTRMQLEDLRSRLAQ